MGLSACWKMKKNYDVWDQDHFTIDLLETFSVEYIWSIVKVNLHQMYWFQQTQTYYLGISLLDDIVFLLFISVTGLKSSSDFDSVNKIEGDN